MTAGVARPLTIGVVAGRQRTAVASTLMKMLRANDWSRYGTA